MKVLSLILLLLLPLPKKEHVYKVEIAGKLSDMHNGDMSAKISVDSIAKDRVFASGIAEGMRGNILVLNGKPAVCYMKDGKPFIDEVNPAKAAILLYVNVKQFADIKVPQEVTDWTKFEEFLVKKAMMLPEDPDKPFPFIVKCELANVQYHVLDVKKGQTYSRDKHNEHVFRGNIRNKRVTLIGFYSRKHHEVFTMKGKNMFIQVIDADKTVIGQVDGFHLTKDASLSLPAN